MEYIIVIIILVVVYILLTQGTRAKDKQADLHNSDEIPEVLQRLNNDESYQRWLIERERELSEESDRLENGYYDNFRYLDFEVAGIHYRTGLAKETILGLDILSEVHLIKEPTNEYDHFAVKVIFDRKRLGYVPRYDSEKVTKLINADKIKKILVINSGRDYASNYPDALSVEIRIYYEATYEELIAEEKAVQEEKERQEAKAKRMLEPVVYPNWVIELKSSVISAKVTSDSQKWELKKIRSNIQNSIRSYDKAIREDKELIAENALKRLNLYKEELESLLSQK